MVISQRRRAYKFAGRPAATSSEAAFLSLRYRPELSDQSGQIRCPGAERPSRGPKCQNSDDKAWHSARTLTTKHGIAKGLLRRPVSRFVTNASKEPGMLLSPTTPSSFGQRISSP